jgi:hypothetical protein
MNHDRASATKRRINMLAQSPYRTGLAASPFHFPSGGRTDDDFSS